MPPPSLEQMVLRTRLRVRERERKGGRVANVGGLLYLVAMPLAVAAIKANFERSLESSVDWPLFFTLISDAGLVPVIGLILGVQILLLVVTYTATYFANLDKSWATGVLIASGLFAIVFHVVYVPSVEGVAGVFGGCLAILGGVFAIGRPLPGEPSHL
ncbi:MAG: hypothetical protein ACT4OI_01380 [Methanobacteriota archaeon]